MSVARYISPEERQALLVELTQQDCRRHPQRFRKKPELDVGDFTLTVFYPLHRVATDIPSRSGSASGQVFLSQVLLSPDLPGSRSDGIAIMASLADIALGWHGRSVPATLQETP